MTIQPIFDQYKIVDKDEIRTYEEYIRSPNEIQSKGTLDYNAQVMKNPNQILEQIEWTGFTEPFLFESDYLD